MQVEQTLFIADDLALFRNFSRRCVKDFDYLLQKFVPGLHIKSDVIPAAIGLFMSRRNSTRLYFFLTFRKKIHLYLYLYLFIIFSFVYVAKSCGEVLSLSLPRYNQTSYS